MKTCDSWLTGFVVIVCLLAVGAPSLAALPVDWQEWDAEALMDISNDENWVELDAREQRSVSDLAWTGFLHDGGASAPISTAVFLRLSDKFHDRLDTTQQTNLAAVIQEMFNANAENLASLGVWDIWRMRRLSRSLGVPDQTVVSWTRTYLQTSAMMFNGASSPELGLLMDWANDIENDLGADMSEIRQSIIDYIDGLSTASGRHNPVTLYTQLRLIGTALNKTSEQERSRLTLQIVDLVQQNQAAFHGMSLWDHHYLRKTAYKAGVDERQIFDWTLEWALNGDAWMHGCDYREFNTMHDWIYAARARPFGRDAERRLADHLRDRLMVDPRAIAVIDAESMGLTRVVRVLASRLDEDELDYLAVYVADQLTKYPTIDGDHWDYENLSSLFDTPQLRQKLYDRVVDNRGMPRINVARLVTGMQRGTTDASLWRAHIEQNAQNDQLPADQRARWLLIQADAASPEGLSLSDTLDPITPRMYAEQALALAPDESTRFECIKWVVSEDMRFHREADAASLLAKEAATFTRPDLVAEIQELQSRVSSKQSAN